jgi:hypothetical protein
VTGAMIPFVWHTFDVRPMLPPNWQAELLQLAEAHAVDRSLVPRSVTSRESDDVESVPVSTVPGKAGPRR